MTERTYYKMEITKRDCFYMAYFWLDATIMDLNRLMDAIALLKSKNDDGRMKEQIKTTVRNQRSISIVWQSPGQTRRWILDSCIRLRGMTMHLCRLMKMRQLSGSAMKTERKESCLFITPMGRDIFIMRL